MQSAQHYTLKQQGIFCRARQNYNACIDECLQQALRNRFQHRFVNQASLTLEGTLAGLGWQSLPMTYTRTSCMFDMFAHSSVLSEVGLTLMMDPPAGMCSTTSCASRIMPMMLTLKVCSRRLRDSCVKSSTASPCTLASCQHHLLKAGWTGCRRWPLSHFTVLAMRLWVVLPVHHIEGQKSSAGSMPCFSPTADDHCEPCRSGVSACLVRCIVDQDVDSSKLGRRLGHHLPAKCANVTLDHHVQAGQHDMICR